MKILISGASGFVGRNLLPHLQLASHETIPLDLRRPDWPEGLSADVSAIIHLAGKAHDVKQTSEASEYFKVNTELTTALFDRFLEGNARDFIYFSSVKAAADAVENVLDEEVQPSPRTPYGQSKLQAEQYLLSQSLPPGKRLFIIRPCMIHGPGNKGNLNLLYKFVARGIPYPLAAFENKRSFLSIDNLCFAIKEILGHPDIPSGIYNLADDESLSTNDLVKLIATIMGKKPMLMNINPDALRTAARIGDRLKLPLNSERLKKLTESYIVSNEKIKRVLGITAFPVAAKEGLAKTISSFASK